MSEAFLSDRREKREWWAVIDDSVRYVTGYSCANNPDTWWCPSTGCSLTEKHHIFKTEAEAIDKLISELTQRIKITADNIEALRLRRKHE